MAFTKVVGAGIHTLSNIASHNINSSGIITATKFVGPMEGDITAVDGTFTGNVTIGGTLTYEDVKNVDSVGIITARDDIKIITDNKKLKLGAGEELQLYQAGNHSIIQHNGNHFLLLRSNSFGVQNAAGTKNIFQGFGDTHSSMYYNGSYKIRTQNTGVEIVGTAVAGALDISGDIDVDGHTNLDNVSVAGVSTFTGDIIANGNITGDGSTDLSGINDATVSALLVGDSIVHTGDTNTKIRFPSNDTISFETAGSERLNLTASRLSLGTNIRVNDYISHQSNDSLGVKFYNASGNSKYIGIGAEDDGTSSNHATFRIYRQGSAVTRLLLDSNGGFKFDGGNFTINDAIVHNNDPNTKIRFPADDQIQLETNGIQWFNIGSTGAFNLGNNSVAGAKVYIKNGNDDANNTNALALDIQGAWMRIGDAVLGDETYNNGIGIKFHNSGTVHWTAGILGSGFYISNTSNNGNQLFPSTRTDAFFLSSTGNATFSGNATVSGNLSVTGTTALSSTVTIPDSIVHDGDTNTKIRFPSADTFTVETGGNEAFRIDSGRRLLHGVTSNTPVASSAGAQLQVHNNASVITASFTGYGNHAGGSVISLGKSRGTVGDATGAVNNGDTLGDIRFGGSDGTDMHNTAAAIRGEVDGSVSSNSIPGRLEFSTNSGSGNVERLRITSAGYLKIPDNAHIHLGGAQSGAGDLQIYHDSSANFNNIQSLAGSNLRIRQQQNGAQLFLAATHIYLQNHDNNQTYLHAQNNSSVTLYHSGNARAYTAADGFALSRVNTFPNPNNTGSEITGAMLDIGGNLHLEERYPAGAYSDRQDLVFRFNTGYGQGFSDKFRFTSGSQLLIGGATSRTINSHIPRLQVQGTNYSGATASIINNSNDSTGAYLFLAKQRSGSAGGSTIVNNGDIIGQIRFSGADGTDLENPMAYIECRVDGTPGSNDVPGRLMFYTTPDGSGSPTERLRITQIGDIYAGNADTGGYAFFDNSTLRPRYQFRQGTGTHRGFAIIETRGDANGQDVFIAKSREGNGTGVINAGDHLGRINFAGADGTNMVNGATIFAYTQSTKTVSTDRMPTNLSFRTHDDDTAGTKERMRIFHDGRIAMSKNGWAGSDASFGLTVHTGSTSDGGNAVNDGIMIVSQNNNGNQNSTTGKLMFCGHAQTNGPFIYAKNAQAWGKKDLVFHTRSTANDYTTQVAETFRITYQGNVGINEPAPDVQLMVRATSDDNPSIKLYRNSGGGDTASINWASSVGTNAQINYRGGSGSEGLQFRTSIGNGNQGSMKERFRINHGNTQGVKIFVMDDSNDAPVGDVTALTIQNGAYGGDIGPDSRPTHIDWQWRDNNSNVIPQCRISGNVGNGGDPNSHEKEGKGFLTFHCSDTGATSGDLDPPQRLRIAHDGTFTGSSSNNISDQRLKENIATITDPIAKIKALKGRTFTWKSEASMREGTHYGFIAQEVESIIPDLIVDNTGIRLFDKDDNLLPSNVITPPVGGGYAKSVDADGVTPVLVEALKEALARIETLEAEVSALKGS